MIPRLWGAGLRVGALSARALQIATAQRRHDVSQRPMRQAFADPPLFPPPLRALRGARQARGESIWAPARSRWQITGSTGRSDGLKGALARAKQGGKGELLDAARLAHIRLQSKTMGSREAQDAINILKRAGDAGG